MKKIELNQKIETYKKQGANKMTVKIEIADWLAKKNGTTTEMKGIIESETEKAVLFNGKAFAEERINCMRCGRELTHPSSRIIGIGPVCCQHLGIHWPDKKELSDEEIESVKEKVEKITLKDWLPKSQITIKDDYAVDKKAKAKKAKIGLHARELKDGTIKKKGVAIKSPYKHKELCKKVKDKFGGRWNAKRKYWQYPLQIGVVDFAKNLWNKEKNGIEMSNMLEEWYNKEKAKREQLIATKAKDNVSPNELNTDLGETLYDFQRVGTHFLSNASGAILADDMGLGKTIQSLAAVDNFGAKSILIVCPASLKLNWGNEIEKWLPESEYEIISGNKEKRLESLKKEARFHIINYAAIREKSRAKVNGEWTKVDNPIFKELHKRDWNAIIFDEAHKIKNRKSQQTKAAKKITKKADKIYHLTGTPIQNKPDEIWSLLNSLDKQKFSSFWRFVNRYCEVWDNGFGKEIGGAKNPKEFREMLKPYMLRRMKEEVIEDMPDLTVNQQWIELEGKQRKIYNQMEKRMVAEFSEQEKVAAPIIISKIMRLKQIAVSQELLKDKPEVKKFKKSAKIKALIDILSGSGDQKVVIFTQFKKAANLVAKVLENENISYGLLTGDINKDKRQKAIDEFQNGNKEVFIATIKAGGLGINLTEGNIAVFLDKDWTPANNNQCIDRLHRIGQEDNVTVVELLAENSIEEYIEKLLDEKQEIFDSLIEGKVTGKEVLMNLKDRMEGGE